MAIVTRFFSTTAAGSGDGTSWANRAELLSSGNWSSVITGFSFAGSDSLRCLIGPGTYNYTQNLVVGLFSTAPTVLNPIYFEAAYSDGTEWQPSNPTWKSSDSTWGQTNQPVIETTSNVVIQISNSYWKGFRFTSSVRPGILANISSVDWCDFENTTSNTETLCIKSANSITNCRGKVTGDYSAIFNSIHADNIRCEGNPSATSGTRDGYLASNSVYVNLSRVTSVRNAGRGIAVTSTGGRLFLTQCTAANNGSHGIQIIGTTGNASCVNHSYVVNNGGWGILYGNTGFVSFANNRLRNNTSGDFSITDHLLPVSWNYTATGTDADELVNVASDDFRIKNTSTLYGFGIGAGDEPASGGGGGLPIGRLISGGV